MKKKKILAICGSIRKKSSNLSILHIIGKEMPDYITYEIFEGLSDIPHFNPDDDVEEVPASVKLFREKVAAADGVLFCTPEYAFGVPGTLKNALDWTVSTTVFSDKKVAVITASSVGENAHTSLLKTLSAISTVYTEKETLLIPFIRSKMNDDGAFKSIATHQAVKDLVNSFLEKINS